MPIDRSAITNRIKKIFQGLTQTEVAKICGVTHQAVSRYFRKGILPNYDAMLKIANYAQVSMEWLLTGEGPKGRLAAALREGELSQAATINIITSEEYKGLLRDRISAEGYIAIPLISEPIIAGDPLVIKEKDIEGFICVYRTWVKRGHSYCCLRVRGDSMHPIISHGFMVAIDLNESEPLRLGGQIVAARHQDEVILRYLIVAEKDYILLPHDITSYKLIAIPRTEPNPIIGRVSWWWGKQK